MCDDILINVFVSVCVCQIYMYLCIKLYIPVFVHQNGQNPRILCFTFLWRTNVFFVAHHFLWRTVPWCATELLWLGPAELFLWRTGLGAPQKYDISVAHVPVRHRKKFCGDDSVAHPANLGVRHRMLNPCATDTAFCGSAMFFMSIV